MNNIPIGQFYRIALDDRDPYWIYGGLQDNHSWMGPSATRHWLGILNQDWTQIGLSDGTGQQVDKSGYRTIYSSSSGGNVQRVDPETGDRFDIKPQAPKGDSAYRWDWDSPLLASSHTAGTLYIGGNRLFISRDRGVTWTRTPDLTRSVNRDTLTLMGVRDRDIKISRNDGESSYSEITTIAESPLDGKVLWNLFRGALMDYGFLFIHIGAFRSPCIDQRSNRPSQCKSSALRIDSGGSV